MPGPRTLPLAGVLERGLLQSGTRPISIRRLPTRGLNTDPPNALSAPKRSAEPPVPTEQRNKTHVEDTSLSLPCFPGPLHAALRAAPPRNRRTSAQTVLSCSSSCPHMGTSWRVSWSWSMESLCLTCRPTPAILRSEVRGQGLSHPNRPFPSPLLPQSFRTVSPYRSPCLLFM